MKVCKICIHHQPKRINCICIHKGTYTHHGKRMDCCIPNRLMDGIWYGHTIDFFGCTILSKISLYSLKLWIIVEHRQPSHWLPKVDWNRGWASSVSIHCYIDVAPLIMIQSIAREKKWHCSKKNKKATADCHNNHIRNVKQQKSV